VRDWLKILSSPAPPKCYSKHRFLVLKNWVPILGDVPDLIKGLSVLQCLRRTCSVTAKILPESGWHEQL